MISDLTSSPGELPTTPSVAHNMWSYFVRRWVPNNTNRMGLKPVLHLMPWVPWVSVFTHRGSLFIQCLKLGQFVMSKTFDNWLKMWHLLSLSDLWKFEDPEHLQGNHVCWVQHQPNGKAWSLIISKSVLSNLLAAWTNTWTPVSWMPLFWEL